MISVPAASTEDNSNLFTVLERGDRRIMQIKKKCIILVGMTRAGKSTTFNWIRRLAMRGVENKYKTNVHFQVVVEGNNERAQLGSSMTSVTLAPNIYHLDDETTLIDMPGYEDRRNYIGVMGVSYFLNAVFQQVEEVKFVLVFDEFKFFDTTGDGIIKTFNGFVNMFNYEEMKGDIKKKFFSSLSVVVTRTTDPTRHFDMMRSISEQLKDDALISDNKDSIIQLIDSIIPSNRIEPFLKARKDQPAPPCKFIDRFNDKLGWTYFLLKQSQALLKKPLINIPFKRDYSMLNGAQQKELDAAIEQRINSYTNYSHILKAAMNNFLNNWNKFIEDISHNKKVSIETIFDLSLIFQNQISSFLAANDKYNSEELIERTFKVEYGTNLVGGIKAMFNIYNIANKISDQLGSFTENMKAYSQYFSSFVDCLQPFCRNAEDQILLLRLKFVLRRGFREFSRFYAIDPEKIHKANQNMKDNCNLYIFEVSKKHYMESFIKQAKKPQLLNSLFRTLPEIQEFDGLFIDYLKEFQHEKDLEDELMYSEIRISIEYVKADFLLAAGEKIKASLAFSSAVKSLDSQKKIISQIADNENVDKKELKKRFEAHFMRKLLFVDKIVGILRTLDVAVKPLAKRHALFVSQDIKDVHTSCEIFEELLIDNQGSKQQQISILEDYIRYCMDWARFDDAKKLLQRRLSLERQSYDTYLEIVKRLQSLQTEKGRLETDYKDKQLQSLKNQESKGLSLGQLLDDIEKYLQA